MLVYDVTQRLSFTHITKWVKDVESKSQSKVGMVLVANKSDLQDIRAVTSEEGQHLAREYGIEFFEASAKTGVNVNEAFERLVDICMVRWSSSSNELLFQFYWLDCQRNRLWRKRQTNLWSWTKTKRSQMEDVVESDIITNDFNIQEE